MVWVDIIFFIIKISKDIFKFFIMDYRVDIISVAADNLSELMKVQTKINQWITTGLLKKYDIHTTSTHVVFNILRNKNTEGEQ